MLATLGPVTQPTPGSTGQRRPRGPAYATAAAVCLVHAVLLVGVAAFYVLELVRGEGGSVATVIMSGVLILVFAGLLALLARVWSLRSKRAAVPTFVWNGLLIPVVVALYDAEETMLATGLLVLVVAGVLTAAWALL